MTLQADQIEAVFNGIKEIFFECQCPELVEGLQFGNIELKIVRSNYSSSSCIGQFINANFLSLVATETIRTWDQLVGGHLLP